MLAACRPRNRGRSPDGVGCGLGVVGRDQQAGHAVDDHLTERPASERHDRRAARLCLGGDHPERLVPPRGTQHDGRAGHRRPTARFAARPVNRHAGSLARGSICSRRSGRRRRRRRRRSGIRRPARCRSPPRRPSPGSACPRRRAVPGASRDQGIDVRGYVGREDRIDGDDPAPRARPGTRRRTATVGGGPRRGALPQRRRDRRVGRQMKRVHHRRAQRRRERDRGRVEGVVVDDVVAPCRSRVDAGEGGVSRAVRRAVPTAR